MDAGAARLEGGAEFVVGAGCWLGSEPPPAAAARGWFRRSESLLAFRRRPTVPPWEAIARPPASRSCGGGGAPSKTVPTKRPWVLQRPVLMTCLVTEKRNVLVPNDDTRATTNNEC